MSGIGTLGELEVMDYLKNVKKFDVYFPLRDHGIDFVAKGKNYYQIQVKTSIFQKNSYFWFDLHRKKMVYSKETYYIFVCKGLPRRNFMGKSHNFIVIPSLKIKQWISKNEIAGKKNDKDTLNIFVYPNFSQEKWFYKNKGKVIDLTEYWNNFNKVR